MLSAATLSRGFRAGDAGNPLKKYEASQVDEESLSSMRVRPLKFPQRLD